MKSGWKSCLLGDAITFQRGYDLPHSEMRDGPYPVIGSNGQIGTHKKYTTEPPVITIGRSGNVGHPHYYEFPCWAHNTTLFVKEYRDVDPRFVFYFLHTLHLDSYGGGSAVPTLNRNHIHNLSVQLPPFPTQRRIAAVLGALDDKIELNRKMNANLEAQAQALFKSWFVDFTPWGGKMPKEWKSYSFSDILSRRSEKVSADACVMYAVTNTGIKSREKIFNKNLAFNGTKGKLIKKGDLVFGMSRAILNWGVMRDALGGVSSAYHVYKVSDIIPSEYLEGYIAGNIRRFTSLIKPAAREGQGFDSDGLMQMSIELPTNSDYTRFKKQYDPLCNMLVVVNEESRKLAETRDALLPKLMSGEVEVT